MAEFQMGQMGRFFYKFTKGNKPPWPAGIKAVLFCLLVRRTHTTLGVGNGAGRDRIFIEQGFHVTAVDKDAHAMAILEGLPQHQF